MTKIIHGIFGEKSGFNMIDFPGEKGKGNILHLFGQRAGKAHEGTFGKTWKS